MLGELAGPTKTRARIFDTEGTLISDSQQLFRRNGGRPESAPPDGADLFSVVWSYFRKEFWTADLPLYKDMGVDGKAYEEVRVALTGGIVPIIRVTESEMTVISVAARSSAIIRCWARCF